MEYKGVKKSILKKRDKVVHRFESRHFEITNLIEDLIMEISRKDYIIEQIKKNNWYGKTI